MQRFESLEEAVDSFLSERRSGSAIDARDFAARHAYLGPDLVDALASLELLEAAGPPIPARALCLGTDLGAYRIVREIGRGGMGVVYEAIEAPFGRRVALKCLPFDLVSKPSARARFEREAEITARLDHSGICTVYGAGVTEDQPWIAMRFVEGETLAQRITAARAVDERWLALPGAHESPRARVLAIARCLARVARALAEAHSRGFVHRDVKPSNVMVTPQGEPVLLDFGLASTLDSDLALTRTGDLPGTPAYLAPEMLSGESTAPDARCDVYSLGVTLYECLALEPPFSGPTRGSLYHAILDGSPRRIADDEGALPRDLEVVVATALERDRARRYAGAAELADDLERVVAGHPVRARPISSVGRVARWAKREPRQAALSIGLAVAALGLAVVGGVYWASRDTVHAAESMVRAKDLERRLVEGFDALAKDDHERADRIFADVLAQDERNIEARAGRVLVSIDRHDEAETRQRLASAPEAAVFEDLRAFAAGGDPSVERPDWLEQADALQLFVSGTRLRRSLPSLPRAERRRAAQRAFRLLTEAALRSPTTRLLVHAERAFAAADAGDPEGARSAAAAVLTLWPDEPTQMLAGALALGPTDPKRSLELLERITRLHPDFALAWPSLARRRLSRGDFDGALAAAGSAIARNPRAADAHNIAALSWASLDCADEARAEFQATVALKPNVFDYWANWGQLECSTGEFARAVDVLGMALALDPTQYQALWWRGFALGELERWDEARTHFEVAAALAPQDPSMWDGLLSATTALQDLDASLLVVERALELRPGRESLLAVKADILRVLRKR